MGEEWSDAEIRGLRERITMERDRAERRARARPKGSRHLIARRAVEREVPRAAGIVTKKKKAG